MVASVSDRYGNEVNSATCYFRIIGRLNSTPLSNNLVGPFQAADYI